MLSKSGSGTHVTVKEVEKKERKEKKKKRETKAPRMQQRTVIHNCGRIKVYAHVSDKETKLTCLHWNAFIVLIIFSFDQLLTQIKFIRCLLFCFDNV